MMTATTAAASSSSLSSAGSSQQQPHHLPGGNNNVTLFQNEQAVIRKAGRQAIKSFLEVHQCFAVLRTSGKVVVFDIRIPIQLAFYALVEHGTFFFIIIYIYVISPISFFCGIFMFLFYLFYIC